MIDALIRIIDRLIKLKEYCDERIEKRFTEVLKPVFDELVLVHRDYIQMLTNLKEIFPSMEDDEPIFWENAIATAEYLKKQRIELEPVRVKLRYMVKELEVLDIGEEGNQFISSIGWYLGPIQLSDRDSGILHLGSLSRIMVEGIDHLIKKKNGGELSKERLARSVSSLHMEVKSQMRTLRERWSDVCETFAELTIASSPHLQK